MKAQLKMTLVIAGILMGCGGGGGASGDKPIKPVLETTTIYYEMTGFVGIDVGGSFIVTVQQGPTYDVEVIIDSSEASKLDVGMNGNTLKVGFLPNVDVRATTLEAVIQMPNLESISLNGDNNTTISGFTGSSLVVSLDGSNVLDAIDCRFDFINATVNGSSLLDFSVVRALPTVNIEMFGSGTTTLNLMDFATVTGSLFGTASLLYYGSDINMEVDAASSATITRLGESR